MAQPSGYYIEEDAPCPRSRLADISPAAVRAWAFKNWKRLVQGAALLVLALAAYSYVNAPVKVEVVPIRTVTTTETLAATGKVRGERVTDLGLDVAGVVLRIAVRDGDRVSAGALLLSLDRSELDARVQSAQASVDSAVAEFTKASRGPLPSEINQVRAELAHARSVGQAKVAQAEARMRNLKAGTRSQEIAAAQAELQSKKDVLAKAQKDLRRTQQLVDQGALAETNLDSAKTDVETAGAGVIAQEQRVNLLKAGATVDQLAEARAAVAEARADRDTGAMAAREKLNTLLAYPRPEDVRAARARVDEARAELRRALDQRDKADLRAPFDGAVADIPVEEGQSVSPGQKLVVLHEISRPIIEVETDEENLSNLAMGQKAVVTADAYPGRLFQARVTDLGSMVNPERGTIQIKLRPTESVNWLRPDLTVDVNIITKRSVKRIMLPPDSLTKYGGQSAVFVIRDGRATPVAVTPGAAGADGIVVSGGLKDGDLVIRNAHNVTAHSDVRAVSASNER
ncbi:MAG: efflux RND transporter periplasmic adaptor subunit [Armatimonadetes bacterium]|nr:efflux RND transporter periplasmic adaptor subunit [Armatimonadota bacterium]